jgi:DNA polymerase III subunit delta
MQINAEQLAAHLKRGIAPVYFISGDEPLLANECADAIRAAAHAAGFAERELYTVESGFDWDALYNATREISLFAARRLIELRLPSGKPGDAGSKALTAIAGDPSPDIVFVVLTGKLEKSARSAKWAAALERAGVAIPLYPIEPARLPAWIEARLTSRGLKPGPGVVEMLAHYTEGNLLACAQEIDKLAMLGGTSVSAEDIEGNLGDSARYSVYALTDACLAGDAAPVLRILGRLQGEGEAPALVLWALTRDVRELARIAAAVNAGRPEASVLEEFGVWQRRRPLVRKALVRTTPGAWYTLVRLAARVDRVIKGRRQGDPWIELERLALALAGLRKGILRRSGEVA